MKKPTKAAKLTPCAETTQNVIAELTRPVTIADVIEEIEANIEGYDGDMMDELETSASTLLAIRRLSHGIELLRQLQRTEARAALRVA